MTADREHRILKFMPQPRGLAESTPQRSLQDGRFAVIGAGWYGCHIGSVLRNRGAEVVIFEATDDVFNGASGHNQNRLHQGFHYPRSFITREQSRRGFGRFVSEYPTLSHAIDENYFAIAANDSIIDFHSYMQIMDASGLHYKVVSPDMHDFMNVTGVIRCEERLIDTSLAADHFRTTLADVLRLGTSVQNIVPQSNGVKVNGTRFDAVISCTWGKDTTRVAWTRYFEPCMTVLYRSPVGHPRAYTIMDGPFYSLYPHSDRVLSLTSVRETPLAQVDTFDEAQNILSHISHAECQALRTKMESGMSRFLPGFEQTISFHGFDFSVKTKLRDASDTRHAIVHRDGPVIDVFAGKIDGVFEAADEVVAYLCE